MTLPQQVLVLLWDQIYRSSDEVDANKASNYNTAPVDAQLRILVQTLTQDTADE